MSDRLRLLAALALLAPAAVGCGDDGDTIVTSTSFQIDTPATIKATPTTAFTPVPTIGPVTGETIDIPIAPSGTSDIPIVPPDTGDTPVIIGVVVGEGTGPDRIQVVAAGSLVSLSILNNEEADEYHIHGYDLGDGQQFAAGELAAFTFTASVTGDFEVESHAAAERGGEPVLLILRVE